MHAANSGRGVATGLSLTLPDLNPLSRRWGPGGDSVVFSQPPSSSDGGGRVGRGAVGGWEGRSWNQPRGGMGGAGRLCRDPVERHALEQNRKLESGVRRYTVRVASVKKSGRWFYSVSVVV